MAAPDDLFRSATLKIERANEHIVELNDLLNAFLKTDFYGFWLERDPKSGEQRVKFQRKTDLPAKIGTVIGDALHNLRSSLDLVASELVRRSGNTPGKHIRFPVRDTRQEVIAAVNGGEIKVAPKTVIDAIVDVVKPYKGGNDAIWTLHALDITDKHHDIIATVSVSGITVNAQMGGMIMENCTFLVHGSGELCAVAMPANVSVQGHAKPVLAIVFDKGQPFDGQPVIPTLHQLSQLVSGSVEAIKNAYITDI